VSLSLVRAGANEFIHRHRDALAGLVLDAGCGHRPYAHLMDRSPVGVDFDVVVRPDVVADVTRLPFATAAFDAVFACELLEHVLDPPTAVREFARVLRPRGRLVLTVPFLYPPHGLPTDFWRLSAATLDYLLTPWFKVEQLTAYGGRLAAVWSMMRFRVSTTNNADNSGPPRVVAAKGRQDWRGRLLFSGGASAFPLGYGVLANRHDAPVSP
jgi:SAM-dependent methyltransferase